MLIWASEKDRKVATAPLHASFTLPKGGGTLQLRRVGNSVASNFMGYPAQNDNVSYGRDVTDVTTSVYPALAGFYTTPTPGESNNYSGSGVAGKVNFSKASSAIPASFQLTLTQASPAAGAVIRYTTNGSVPIATSTQYVNPIVVNTTMIVRARVFKSGSLPGETDTRGYYLSIRPRPPSVRRCRFS
jgi:hypothetical protein